MQGSATLIAEDIRSAIRNELQLTASAGIAPVKFLAKIAVMRTNPMVNLSSPRAKWTGSQPPCP